MPMGRGANQGGLSRKHIFEGIEASLTRLGLDYVDQLIIHRHPHGIPGAGAAPIEETLEALNDVVKAGKALYIGASSMFAWQFTELQLTSQTQRLDRVCQYAESLQPHLPRRRTLNESLLRKHRSSPATLVSPGTRNSCRRIAGA